MKSLALNITNQKLSFDIFTVENVRNIFMEHDLYVIVTVCLPLPCVSLPIFGFPVFPVIII